MRAVLALVVIAALSYVGWQAVGRITEREQPEVGRDTSDAVAAAWAQAMSAGDVEALVELASDRSDVEELQAMHEDVLGDLGELQVAVVAVTEDDNLATATLANEAAPVPGAAWQWESTLPLIRTRGEWSVDWVPSALHPDLDTGWRFEVDVVPASRAPVLDREGRALSRTGDVVEIGVQPGRLPERERVLLTIADHLPQAFEPVQELLDRDDLNPDWYYPLVTVPVTVADEAWPDLLSLPGLLRRDGDAGTGPATVAADVVGTVELDENGERVGTSGLELVYDERLRGSATTEVHLRDPDGGDRGTLYSFQQDVRPPLVTTLDADVQRTVEDVLDGIDERVGVVVVDPATVGITAVVSRPATGFNRAFEGLYPPALVAGTVPLAAALDAGASVDDRLACPASGTAGGVTVSATRPDGDRDRDLAAALAGPCDVGVARLGVALGGQAMVDAVALLGLDAGPDLPLPAAGLSWPPTTTEAAHASAAVGHAQVQASPLAGAVLAAAVARGAPATPVLLVEDVVDATPWPSTVATGLRTTMRTAGEQGAVGAPGVRVAGLRAASGTVRGDPAPATGWWVGFLEGDGPDLALAVVVEGDDGSRAATIADVLVDRLAG